MTLLEKIKKGLGITGTYQDDTLQVMVDEVKQFMLSAGVEQSVIGSDISVGCIMQGVKDLWNNETGVAKYSDIFTMRLIQLKQEKEPDDDFGKLFPFLYKKTYKSYSYDMAKSFFEKYKPSACSVVRKGNLIGRNFDYPYDETCEFVVKTKAVNGRHATIGIARTSLTAEKIESGEELYEYAILPFLIVDGINDSGLFAEVNTTSNDYGLTTGTNEGADDMAIMICVRYILDYAGSVDEAIALLRDKNIWCPNNSGLQSEYHLFIADKEKSVAVEFINNELKITDEFVNNKPIMTNFFLYGFDGTHDTLTRYGQGFERWQILSDNYANIDSELSMIETMRKAKYTNAYRPNYLWYSDFTDFAGLTNESPAEDFMPVIESARQLFNERTRNGATWQTVHTAVYDLEKLELIVIPQESGEIYRSKINV